VPDTPSVPGETAAPEQVIAGLRAANMRLRELLAERDAQIAELPVRVGQVSLRRRWRSCRLRPRTWQRKRRASRRPWWRGGGRRRNPLCGPPLFAKRALWLAACYAEGQGESAVGPEHLLYGVLRDLDDPYDAQLGRRGRRHLTQLGWTIGTVNPAGALLQAHGIEPIQLRAELDHTP